MIDSRTVQRFFIDKHGHLEKSISGQGVTSRAFDAHGNITSHVDALGATTLWKRDATGQIIEEIDALGHVTRTRRDVEGRPLEISDDLGIILTARYDARGNPTEMTAARGDTVITKYNPRGLPIERVRPDGESILYEYDGHFNLTKLTQPNDRVWRYEYDGIGRVIACTDPAGAVTRYAWNDRWQPVAEYAPNGDVYRYRYDRGGNCVEMSSSEQRSTRRLNGHGQTIEILQANGHKAQFRYDREGFLIQVINENGDVMRLGHDVNGLVTSVEHFDERRVYYKYDLRGNLIRYTDGVRGETAFEYDLLGQVTRVTYPDGSAAELTYDQRGRLIAAKNDAGEQTYEVDAGGLLTKETLVVSGHRFDVEWAYDVMRQTAGVSSSLGHRVGVHRRPSGQIEAVQLDPENALSIAYDAGARERARTFPGQARLDTSWNDLLPIQHRLWSSATFQARAPSSASEGDEPPGLVFGKSYEYTATRRLKARWDYVNDGKSPRRLRRTDYEYDARGRLLQRAVDGAHVEEFTHDPASNVSSSHAPSVYGPGNRLLRRGDSRYFWDGDGRLIEKVRARSDGTTRRWRYEWAGAGTLRRVTDSDGQIVEFTYDPFGRRLSKSVHRQEALGERRLLSRTYYVWDRDRLMHELREDASSHGKPAVMERTYAYDDLDVIAHRDRRVEGGLEHRSAWTFYLHDVIGTPEQLIRGDGSVVGRLERSAYGMTRPTLDSQESTSIRFEGQYEDSETGLHYNRYRYYDPEIGRYISPDPAGGPPDLNLYKYCLNPIYCVDPLGLHNASAEFSNPNSDPPIPPTSLGHLDSGSDPRMYEDPHTNNASTYRAERDAKRNPGRTAFNKERFSDTEARAIRDVEGKFTKEQLQGGTLKITGELPPCRSCRGRMEDFAARNNCNVEYHYPLTGEPKGTFTSRGNGDGRTATSSWDHPPEIPLNSGARPANGYNREEGLAHGYADWRPPRPDATPSPIHD